MPVNNDIFFLMSFSQVVFNFTSKEWCVRRRECCWGLVNALYTRIYLHITPL